MKSLKLRGQNIWGALPMLEVWLEIDPRHGVSQNNAMQQGTVGGTESGRRFADDLLAKLIEHGTAPASTSPVSAVPISIVPAARERLRQRLAAGISLAEVVGEFALLLQVEAGNDVQVACAQPASQPGLWKIAVQCRHHAVAETAVAVAVDVVTAVLENRPLSEPAQLAALHALAAQFSDNSLTAAIRTAARSRHIPLEPVGEQGVLQLGHGARQHRLHRLQTDRTSAAAITVADDLSAARKLLSAAGVPVADQADVAADASWYRLFIVSDRLITATTAAAPTTPADQTHAVLEVTALVHPSVAMHAREAVRMLGLDVAGVLVATSDIGLPLEATSGAIVNVESAPQLPTGGGATAEVLRHLAEAVLDTTYAAGATARIPIAAVTGVNGKTTTTRLISHILGVTGRPVGMTCTDGIFLGARRISTGDCSGPQSARSVLCNPRVEAAVLETARGGILREGLGFDRCDVAVVTNIGDGDHLGLNDIHTVEQLARVKRVVVEAVTPGGAAVLNAADPLVAAMQPHCPGSVIFFALDPQHPVIVAWRAAGHRAVIVRDGAIHVAEGEREFPLLSLDRVPLTHQGRVRFQVENALAATAATWSLGVPVEVIRTGLETFIPTTDQVPGRFNLLDVNGATIVFDYGHNPAALNAIIDSLDQFPHNRRLCLYSAAGDRRDCDMVRLGELIGHAFDQVVLYEDHYLRGRQTGEIIGLIRQGLTSGKRVREIHEVQGWNAALQATIDLLQPGDLALVQADTSDLAVNYMRDYLASHPQTREVSLSEALHMAAGVTRAAGVTTSAAPTTADTNRPRPDAAADSQKTPGTAVPVATGTVEERLLTHP
ncbi:MAG: UDP-N-acetylmuramyl tripeptide synthase [Planctomycetia bacterium]|nr:UDP-N-acetylmuramyl tripeptide synthase [Planctomycetia bacterium]